MIKKFLSAITIFTTAAILNAQTPNFSKYPKVVGVELDLTTNASSIFKDNNNLFVLNTQTRGNIQGSPWSFGINLGLSIKENWVNETFNRNITDESGNTISKETSYLIYTISWPLIIGPVVEYDFGRGRLLNPYINASLGICTNQESNHYGRADIGVELCHFARISYTLVTIPKNYFECYVSLGFVLGGWPNSSTKKNPLTTKIGRIKSNL